MNKTIGSMLVREAMSMIPPVIGQALLEDQSFVLEWNISPSITLTLSERGPSFRRDRLYDRIRSAMRDPGTSIAIEDQSGHEWELVAQIIEGNLNCLIRTEGSSYLLKDHTALSDDEATRIGWFERYADELILDLVTRSKWSGRLHQSSLTDREYAYLMEDLAHTPAHVFVGMQEQMRSGSFNVSDLVPHELRYYERLVGPRGNSATVAEHIEHGVKLCLEQLIGSTGGVHFALLMCSTAAITAILEKGFEDRHRLTETLKWLLDLGDPMSCVAAVEVGLRRLDVYPELAPYLERIVHNLLADDAEATGGQFSLLSSIAIVVASELTRRRTLKGMPPFFRRQATLAQSSLIFRAINATSLDKSSIVSWANDAKINHMFMLQALIDLRHEPRWLPDFLSADQLRAEFVGRIIQAATENEANIQSESLRSLLLGPESKLSRACSWLSPFLPGPLEGELFPLHLPPESLLERIRADLQDEHLTAGSFATLSNAAILFSVPRDLAELASLSLRRVQFTIEGADHEKEGFKLLSGLAVAAATTRTGSLSETLRVLVRVLRRRNRLTLHPISEMRIALISAAAFESLDEWARFSGEWITEIAFESTDRAAMQVVRDYIRCLVGLEPALAKHCASADAAADAFAH